MQNPYDLPIPPINPAHNLEQTQALWEKELGYTCEAERTLIRQMAAAALRADRCQRADDAHESLNLHKARAKQLEIRRKRIRKLAQSLPKNPSETLDQLESTKEGREWLAGHWRQLDKVLVQALPLTPAQRNQAMNLMGYHGAAPGTDAPMFVRELWANLLQAEHPDFRYDDEDLGYRKHCIQYFVPPPVLPADAFQARTWLRDLCGDERIRLDRLQTEAESELRDNPELRALAEAEEQALQTASKIAATDPAAQARAKVEHQADLSYARNLGLLMRLRNGRQKEREWELKESRRRPVDSTPVNQAHRPTSIVATQEEPTTSAPPLRNALQRTDSAPTPETSAPTAHSAPAPTPQDRHEGVPERFRPQEG